MSVLIYLLLGAAAGLLSGTLGLGGGIVIVPALLAVFALQGLAVDVAAHMAVATSLATIAVTSISAIRSHHALGNLRWPLALRLGAGIIVGAFAGAFIASLLPGRHLASLFGFFAMLVAVQMALSGRRRGPSGPERLPNTPLLVVSGVLIGTASGIFGIGGGSLTVPFLSWCRVRMQQAVAVSAAGGFPIAVGGCAGFVITGWGNPLLPDWSLGFIYLPAAAAIVVTSFPCARVGARIAHRLPAQTLKRVFAAVLFLIGLRLLWSA